MIKKIFENFASDNIFIQEKFEKCALFEKAILQHDIESHRPPKEQLRELVGKQRKYPEEIGAHPDFSNIRASESEYHYIVSVFVDIKGSTALAAKLPLEDVRFIKNGILVTAIDIFQAFDGHVHRLQGDAIFAFFGRKTTTKANAIIDALNATSFLQSFFNNNLSKTFESMGFPPIKIRIGIDYGDDNQVLWTNYGIKNCNEITTTSVHTDLAAKLQSKASANSIMIGQNVIDYLDLPDEFYLVKKIQKDGEQVEDKFVINNSIITYRMWHFSWDKYLNKFAFLEKDYNRYPFRSPQDFQLKCFYKTSNEDEFSKEYRSNCGALPKGISLKYILIIAPYMRYDTIQWQVINRGIEAKLEEATDFYMDKYRNKRSCLQYTKYKGHHYMRCTLKYQGRIIGEEYFGIYIN